jgi:carboxypeptidase T
VPYLNVAEVESNLASAESQYPGFIQRYALPYDTWENRKCHAIKIASGSGLGRIGIYFIGGVHAREWVCPDILIYFVEELAKAYHKNTGIALGGNNFTAAQIKDMVNKLDIFVFPQVNPDGRHFSQTIETTWRKNRRPAPSTQPGCPGVDNNRNFDFLWNYPAYFDPSAPVSNSTNPCDQVYIGPGAISEPETKNVVWMMDSFPNIRFLIDVHSYSKLILYVWGDDDDQTADPNMNFQNPAFNTKRGIAGDAAYREYIDGCDQALGVKLANRVKNAIHKVRNETYTVQQSFNLYPTAGTSTDYASSRHFADRSKGKIYSYCIECGDSFWPTDSERQGIIEDVTAGLLEFCVGVLESQADVYIKDNVNDTGVVPYGGRFWDNSDVIVRQNDDNVFVHEAARRGQTNYIYVRVTNLGPNTTDSVRVTARAVRFPGTEFIYPNDWTSVDATHLEPIAVVNTFNNIPVGNTRIAKFGLSPAQVEVLWGWQSGGWHPCLLAEVEGCNDYGSPVGVHVWENNNLGQRNVSIVPSSLNALVSFAFLAGHALNLSNDVELVIDRRELPENVELLLDPFDRGRYFDSIPPTEPELGGKVTFLDRTRLEIGLCGREGILTLLPGSSFQSLAETERAVLSMQGAQLVHRDGRTMLSLHELEAVVRLQKRPGRLHQVALRFRVPASAKPGDVYRIHVAQRNAGLVVGGITLVVAVATEGPDVG